MAVRLYPVRSPLPIRHPRLERSVIIDFVVIGLVAAVIFAMTKVGSQVSAPFREVAEIDLSPKALPKYALFSVSRATASYMLSLIFTLVYGYIAAKRPRAEAAMVLTIDVLQSIPVLGFMPGVVLALTALFPKTNLGLELSAVVMIFTGQAWNMTFSFYHSLREIPVDLVSIAKSCGFGRWKTFRKLELPYAVMGLVWNSMMSVAGGWLFLMVCEAFVLGDKDYRLPGLGSYMSVAFERKDWLAVIWGISTMVGLIVVIDQLIWKPVIAWAQKFRYEETTRVEVPTSALLEFFRKSTLLGAVSSAFARLRAEAKKQPLRQRGGSGPGVNAQAAMRLGGRLANFLVVLVALGVAAYGVVGLGRLVAKVTPERWAEVAGATGLTFLRTMGAVALGSLWVIPIGVTIGLKPRVARFLQPVMQALVAFPATMVFPLIVLGFFKIGVELEFGSVILTMVIVQWYVLFNTVAGAMSIPGDLLEVCEAYQIKGWRKWRMLILPAIFPALVTGWLTAAGGAWNASIVTEYVRVGRRTFLAHGLGAEISKAAENANFPELAAAILMMTLTVVAINRILWKRLQRLAEERFTLG